VDKKLKMKEEYLTIKAGWPAHKATRRIEFIVLASSLVRSNQRFVERLCGKIPKFHISGYLV
jgi:hypothetical protein